ncbi:MAG: glycosyltransferase family 4 protein [Bacteroidia bacterium]|jgi:glycosyltransferase involved in cell wall biosynthesis|nr:glycosyltransferase family 4 protein [Bacteroidia bacterium]
MRILQLMNRVPWPLIDGGSIMYYQYLNGYQRSNCDVSVIALNTSKHYVNELPVALTNIADWHLVAHQNDVTIGQAFLNLFSGKSYHMERFYSKPFEEKLISILQETTFDTVVCETIYMAQYIDTIRKYSKAKIVLRQHNVEHQIWKTLAINESNLIKKGYYQLLASRLKKAETTLINAADGLSTVTQNDSIVFAQMGCKIPMHVGPLGIDNEVIQRIPKSDPIPFSCFHIGSMEWQPNIDGVTWLLKNVWPKVVANNQNAQLHLAGRKLNAQTYLPFTQQVFVDGEVDDAHAYMQQHQIMLVPLFSGSGIRVKIVEGMALGKVIISTSLGAQGIPYTHGQNIMIADTADEFYQCIVQLMNNQELCNVISKQARQLAAEEFSQSKIIADAIAFYQNLNS